jgi:hypothetical protein
MNAEPGHLRRVAPWKIDDALRGVERPLFVSLGGGLLTTPSSEYRPDSQESDSTLVIASRIAR